MLEIYNSLTRSKVLFEPIEPGKVRMYVCGMTVYDYCHLGHARVLVVFDVVVRYLRALGYEVTYVRNVTDVDDKIIQRAHDNGEPIGALTERFIAAMHEDSEALGVIPPDIEPRATTAMQDVIAMVKRLVETGSAYVADNSDVYYDVNGFPGYGRLSGKRLEDLRAGARVGIDEAKRDPLDFVLWKAAKPGEPSWDSPWGPGRPGWHIECSAMSTRCLGAHFDIHGGGMDLQFPHHENEIAQSEAATGHTFVNVWMHNGFVQVDEEKMSKSLGNFFTVREIMRRYRAEEIRYFVLASHYRSPLNYNDDNLDQARSALTRLYTALRGFPAATDANDISPDEAYLAEFHRAMSDDFNTPEALAIMFRLAHEINKAKLGDSARAAHLAVTLRHLGTVLGLLQAAPETYLQNDQLDAPHGALDANAVDVLIKQRNRARAERNWAEADRIRAQLSDQGVVLEDDANGTTWRRQ